MIKAVFFDMYGTLAGFRPSRYEVQSKACRDFGIEVTPEGVIRGYAAADAYMSEQNAAAPVRLRSGPAKEAFFAEYERFVLRGCGVDVSAELAAQIWRRLRRIPYGLAPFDDAAPTLGVLRRRGVTVGMISNIDQTGGEIAGKLGLGGLLDVVVTSGEVGVDKPDPAIFRTALERAGAQPGEAMHVGDQPASDVEGAARAGIAPVLLDRDGIHSAYDRCPRISTLTELPPLVA